MEVLRCLEFVLQLDANNEVPEGAVPNADLEVLSLRVLFSWEREFVSDNLTRVIVINKTIIIERLFQAAYPAIIRQW
jgi:hypothetical protein